MSRTPSEQAAAELRRRAELRLASQPPPAGPQDEAGLLRAVHELRVHQIELELQNEALQQAESEAREALQALAQLNRSMEAQIELRTAELAAALQAAEAASSAKSAFLSNMSHELRTPLSGVIGMLELALRRPGDARLPDWLGKARHAAGHLLAVINDILDLSKIEANKLQLQRAEFRLGAVLELVSTLMAPEAARRGIGLHVELPPALAERPLLGDRQRLGQVLVNLVGNAVKFTDAGSVNVRVGIDQETADALTVRFEVRDTGIGIAPQHHASLFHPFQQIDDSMSRPHAGTGLGLAICARMVQLMGGQIGFESTPGVGSTFWFRLPLGTLEAADATVSPAVAPDAMAEIGAACAGMRILLAEDNTINQEVLCGLLESVGLVVDLAGDGPTAVQKARDTVYALILMDLQLPRLSGIDATRAIRQGSVNAATPIIALTASVFNQDRMRCIDAGMDDHLAKPVDPGVLYATLRKWLKPVP